MDKCVIKLIKNNIVVHNERELLDSNVDNRVHILL